MKVGKYLKRMREDKKMSQVQMGEIIGKRPERICEWEKDKHAIKLTEFLDIVAKLKIKNINRIFRD